MPPLRALILSLVLLLAACSLRSAMNSLTSDEDRALAMEMVTHLRGGDEAWLQQRFGPDLWEQSVKEVAQAPGLYPTVPGTTELVSFNISSNMSGGTTERTKEFMLVTHGGGRWTVTNFRTHSTGGPDQVVRWSVTPHSSPPAELVMLESVDAALPWVWGGAIVLLAAIAGLIFWLVRRSRRKRGQATGTP